MPLPPNPASPSPAAHPARRRRFVAASLLSLALFATLLTLLARSLHPFLAPTQRLPTPYLVVEGWLPDYALEQAAAEFKQHGYSKVFTTGGPLPRGAFLSEFRSYAALAAASLAQLGIPTNNIVPVESLERVRNRTFASALSLARLTRDQFPDLHTFNLVSLGAHARRSQLCFDRAFPPEIHVGVLAIENQDYDPHAWWRFSEGTKTVLGESLALAYAWVRLDNGP